MTRLKTIAFILSLGMLVGLWIAPVALAEEKPHYGGVMRVAIQGDPPSLDMHQESTFLVMIPFGNVYNTLLKYDPHNHDEIVGDLAESWTQSEDGLTYTFKLRKGVKFHDGTDFDSADAKASWDKIVFPPKGVISNKRSWFEPVKSIEAPDKYTLVFHMKRPAPSFIPIMALDYNFIYSKENLDQDPNWYRKNANGTGPYRLKRIQRGSFIEMERNPNYWKKGLPYLDGIKYFMIKDTSARAKSVRTGRTHVELRGFPPAEIEAMKKQMGDDLVVRYPRINLQWGVAFNLKQKPFDDVRVRKAMSLALDRYEMSKVLEPLTGLSIIGGIMHPDSKWALPMEELQQYAGFGKDYDANVAEAKRLLAEAGYPDGFETVLSNRAVKLPYIDFGVYLVSAWRKVGIIAQHKLKESATWRKDNREHNFLVNVDPMGSPSKDPDASLQNFITNGQGNDWFISDPEIDDLFKKQSVELNEKKRLELVYEIQRRALDQMYWIPGLYWKRQEARSALIKNYEPMHYHHMNRRMEDVWLAEK
jgi:peptide/nickel transport system substrate-binding protein